MESPSRTYLEPLSEAESMYLRSRLAMPGVLLGFGLIGLGATVYVLVTEWPERAYFFLAILILDMAATFLLWRVFRKLRSDVRGGRKRVVEAPVEKKLRKGAQGACWVVVDRKAYRVLPEVYDECAEGQWVRVSFSPVAGVWLGLGQSEAKVSED